jgi:hypothetical protein
MGEPLVFSSHFEQRRTGAYRDGETPGVRADASSTNAEHLTEEVDDVGGGYVVQHDSVNDVWSMDESSRQASGVRTRITPSSSRHSISYLQQREHSGPRAVVFRRHNWCRNRRDARPLEACRRLRSLPQNREFEARHGPQRY